MSFSHSLKTNKGYQLGTLVVSLLTLFTFVIWIFSGDHDFDDKDYDLNEILSGSSSQSDIVKSPLLNYDLVKPFLQNKYENNNWEFHGDALVSKNQYVRVTSEKPNQSGLIQSRKAIPSDIKGFQMDFSFSINGQAKSNGLKGDGFALFITEDKLQEGPVFGANDFFKGLGLFFDTYRNANKGRIFPMVSLMKGDGHTAYDKDHDGKANEIAGCSARGIYNPREGEVKARLIYTEDDGYLSFDYQLKEDEWKNCFSITEFYMPGEKWVAFGGETGELSENVDIYSFQTFQLLHNDQPITSYDSYLVQEEEENFELSYTIDNRGRKVRVKSTENRIERTRERREKLTAKLKYKEQLKRREMERRGYHTSDDANWVFFKLIWKILKWVLFMLLVLIIVWVGFTVYRVKIKSKRKVGLLD